MEIFKDKLIKKNKEEIKDLRRKADELEDNLIKIEKSKSC
jgi:hypothetical protein